MSTTVKELSQKLNLKRNSIEMRMSQIPNFRKKYVTRKGNRLIISNKGGDLICNLYGGRKRRVNSNVKKSVNDRVNDYQIDSLRKMLKQEKLHNKQLQKQLNIANLSNKHLGQYLSKEQNNVSLQQHLQLAAQSKVHELRGQIKRLKVIPGQVDKSINKQSNNAKTSQNSSNNSKPGFWHRFFNNF